MLRPSANEYWSDIVKTVARRSTCTSRVAVGAILVDPYKRLVATGYNGAPTGLAHCDDVGCMLDTDNHCIIAVHAEANAIIQCARSGQSSMGTIAYVTHSPCPRCATMLVQAGVFAVYYLEEYGDINLTAKVLAGANVPFVRMDLLS